ncbi:hypothetical protein SAMN05444372_109129 [Flavobacterium micromati]|uniref:CarboxypepD_reg-like domain-containing protein n=1 Tax=Flavobacterium micromati TaxID=229205 RepID=A0A1M5MCJ3_9FLAO|nr:hypothetical protein [Flavobacterium micromati]SHG74987.1 hypothetical protein SAMN05444372_109129 [Flavobacterium micromati]
MIKIVYFFLAFNAMQIVAQDRPRIQINGKVSADFMALENIYVINKITNQLTKTNQQGFFKIEAMADDTLLFSGSQFLEFAICITQNNIKEEIFTVNLNQEINQLDEVIVQSNINAVSLGIIPKGQKSYTAAERKLYTATDLNASANVGSMMGGSISADPLLNWISGRTKMLKKDLEVEKKEFYLKRIQYLFPDDYFINTLKIPAIYIKGFEYYIIENQDFVKILESNNAALSAFFIGDLAIKYKEIIASNH